MNGLPALLGLSEPDLARAVAEVAPERYRAKQLMTWMYERRAASFAEMTDLSKALRERLAEKFVVGLPTIVSRTPAEDGAEKFLFELADGARIEAVYIPSENPEEGAPRRITICLSSQAGCALDCTFCVTGRMGAGRNLTPGEIVGQYLAIAKERGIGPHEANLVFMGMGEPLLNAGNVLRALDLFEREVSPRKITISTAGVVPGIDLLATRTRRPNLAVSLTAPDDVLRSQLMPVNNTYPLADLFAALRRWPLEHGRRITFEYVLIKGVNDHPAHAAALAKLVRPLSSKVNVIPLNESREWLPGLQRPSEAAVDAFARDVEKGGVPVTVRWSKGLGGNAACGQLKGRETPRHSTKGAAARLANEKRPTPS